MSDSLEVRRLAKCRLGAKLVTDIGTSPGHLTCHDGGSCDSDSQVQALRLAVGDLLSFSLTDYHVYSQKSGFGRMGAWLSLNWHHQYSIKGGAPRKCGIADNEDLRDDAHTWSGV
jgi:hypothetical protein